MGIKFDRLRHFWVKPNLQASSRACHYHQANDNVSYSHNRARPCENCQIWNVVWHSKTSFKHSLRMRTVRMSPLAYIGTLTLTKSEKTAELSLMCKNWSYAVDEKLGNDEYSKSVDVALSSQTLQFFMQPSFRHRFDVLVVFYSLTQHFSLVSFFQFFVQDDLLTDYPTHRLT